MNVLRRILLVLVVLVPLVALFHKDDLRRWDVNRSAMVAPDEFSYLLTADGILHGPHLSTRETLGIDTFYPPGYSLILAVWALIFGLTTISAHVLNTLLVCAATGVVYLFSRRLLIMLGAEGHRRFVWSESACAWFALLVAALFATNWHVLEGALFVLSEPAFMLATFAWLALPLKWPDWHVRPGRMLVVALLAVLAWSIRGAGIVCVAVTILYPAAVLVHSVWRRERVAWRRLIPLAIVLGVALAYQAAIMAASPSRSLTSNDAAANSYPHQLLHGITDGGRLHFSQPGDWKTLAWHVTDLGLSHLNDYSASYTPWFRDPPDDAFRDLIARLFGGLGLLGFAYHLTRRNKRGERGAVVLDAYILCYFALYLIWPFNMMRFWAPILPVMLVYGIDGVREFWSGRRVGLGRVAAGVLFGLLLVLSAEEIVLQLGHYQRRINLVSDALASAAKAVVKASPHADMTTVAVAGNDEHFIFAWYLPRVPGGGEFMPVSPRSPEHVEAILLRAMKNMEREPGRRLFTVAYFGDPDYRKVLENVRAKDPQTAGEFELRKVFQNENIVTVWEFRRRGPGG